MIKLIFSLLLFGLGYTVGRRIGLKQGKELGLVQTIIDLRIAGLEKGRCPLCFKGVENPDED
ncbi:MAG TPA: hypothetical protein VN462_04210 [Negativicutes bacterium]|nr:hypothetical protein [Negativicutes bacterium]